MILIDVRTKDEFNRDHIDKAINFDIMDMMEGNFPDFSHNEEIHVYCESGNRSMMAQKMMLDAGFTNVVDVGGIDNLR